MSDDALKSARLKAADLDPLTAAQRVGATWDAAAGTFAVPFFGSTAVVSYPEYEVAADGDDVPPHIAALLVYHLALSDGSPPTGTWISFGDLPNASFYVTAFRGYTAQRIARAFASRADALDEAARQVGGAPLDGPADREWRIPALPNVPLALLWWDADDEFDARAELLFDSATSHHLTTDGCAILGSWLTSLLVRHES